MTSCEGINIKMEHRIIQNYIYDFSIKNFISRPNVSYDVVTHQVITKYDIAVLKISMGSLRMIDINNLS